MIAFPFRSLTKSLLLVALLLNFIPQTTYAEAEFANLDKLIKDLNFAPYYTLYRRVQRPVRIAILDDSGFFRYEEEVGRTLPSEVVFHAGPNPQPIQRDDHGVKMAQLVWALMTKNGEYDEFEPEMHLFDAFGFTNFKAALKAIGEGNFDLVLNSQVRTFGGNGDGGGYINDLVSEAIAKSIKQKDKRVIWFNAAGNLREHTYVRAIEIDEEGWVKTGGANNEVRIRCRNPDDKRDEREGCDVRLILSWGRYTDDPNDGTAQDLDLVLSDDTLKIVETEGGSKIQKPKPPPGDPKYSRLPREEASAHVEAGVYFVRFKARSENFLDGEELQLYVQGDGVELVDKNLESSLKILPPADNPDVITVGAYDSERSNQSYSELKPDLTTVSAVRLRDGRVFMGSSNSTAFLVAAAGMLLSLDPSLDREQVEEFLTPASPAGGSGGGERRSQRPQAPESSEFGDPSIRGSRFVPPMMGGAVAVMPFPPGPPPAGWRPSPEGRVGAPQRGDRADRGEQGRSSSGVEQEMSISRAMELGCSVTTEGNSVLVECPFELPKKLTERARMMPPFSRRGLGVAKLPSPIKVIKLYD